MPASLCSDSFSHEPESHTVTAAQAAFLKIKVLEEGVSSGLDEHWIESWLFEEFQINVNNVEELTTDQFRLVVEEMGWDE
jgi:hypothetical protein